MSLEIGQKGQVSAMFQERPNVAFPLPYLHTKRQNKIYTAYQLMVKHDKKKPPQTGMGFPLTHALTNRG